MFPFFLAVASAMQGLIMQMPFLTFICLFACLSASVRVCTRTGS